jgi:hypothetical protein
MKLQLTYDIIQDRLLLSIALPEAPARGYWLTRRFTVILWTEMTKQLAVGLGPGPTEEARDWLLAVQHETAAQQNPAVAEAPLALESEPILVTTMKYGQQDGGQVLYLLDLQEQGEAYLFNNELLHAFLAMLAQEANNAGWALTLEWPKSGTDASERPSVLH